MFLLFVGLFGFLAFRWAFPGSEKAPFTKQTWSVGNPEERGCTLDQLIDSYSLEGSSREDIVDLLGPQTKKTESTFLYNVGYRGASPSLPFAFSSFFLLQFDNDGKVSHTHIDD